MMSLIDLKKTDSVTNKCYFRLGRSDYGKVLRHALGYACEQLWLSMLQRLRPGQPPCDLVVWHADSIVTARPASSEVDETNRRFKRSPGYEFTLRDYRDEKKAIAKIQDAEEAEQKLHALQQELLQRLSKAIVRAFELKSIQSLYQDFNPSSQPFSILLTLDDESLQTSQYKLLWKNRAALSEPKLLKKLAATKGKALPKESRELSTSEAGQERRRAQRKKEQAAQQKARAKKKKEEEKTRAKKAASKLPAKAQTLTPNIFFRSGTVVARCKKAWITLFAHLYEFSCGAQARDVFLWELDGKQAKVTLTARSTNLDESSAGNRKAPSVSFKVDAFKQALKKATNGQERDKLQVEFIDWLQNAIVRAFESEAVQVEYSWFNQTDAAFSTLSTTKDKGLHASELNLLLSMNGGLDAQQVHEKQACLKSGLAFKRKAGSRKTKPTRTVKKKATKLRQPTAKTFAASWRRFYTDDGVTRRFWYIQRTSKTTTVLEGPIAESGSEKKSQHKSVAAAKQHVEKLVADKIADGWIEYAPHSQISYRRKNRFPIALIRKAMKAFEKQYGQKIPEEYRRYLLTVNGGDPSPDSISLPGHPHAKLDECITLLGFKAGQPAFDLDYFNERLQLPEGHLPVADGRGLFSLDRLGVVYFWQTDSLDRRDFADDNVLHVDRLPPHPAAHSFDEFLTRLSKFPNDTKQRTIPPKIKTPAEMESQAQESLRAAKQRATTAASRRFYFDDGETRKFWHIQRKGKSFTTRYGRLGSPGSETKKTLSSPDAAEAAAEKIIRQKQNKGYQEVLPDALVLERAKGLRGASNTAIQKLEKQIGGKLPGEFREFLAKTNGGRPIPSAIAIPNAPHIQSVGLDYLFGLYSKNRAGESLHWAIETYTKILPPNQLPIAQGSDLFTLSLKKNVGAVYFWDHGSDDIHEGGEVDRFRASAGRLLAHSFDEFLARIANMAEGEEV